METAPIERLSLEIILEILSYLDNVDRERSYYASRLFYYARLPMLLSATRAEILWLRAHEYSSEIPRSEMISHNALLRTLNRTYSITPPEPDMLDTLVNLYAQELISAYVFPTNIFGRELRINESVEDDRLYHQRYPLLKYLALILRWNGVGCRIARIIQAWLETKWNEINDEPEVQEFIDPDYKVPPTMADLEPHQEQIIRGVQWLACHAIVHFAPQDVIADDIGSSFNDEAWADPEFDRLKLWLNIPELWTQEIWHMEVHKMQRPFRCYQQIVRRPFLQIVLFTCCEFGGLALRLLSYIRSVELSTPYPDPVYSSRYWYEEVFCGARLLWNFHQFKICGLDMSIFKRPFVDLIRGYIYLFGPATLSDLMLNIVFILLQRTKPLPIRWFIGKAMLDELLAYGYQFLSDEAKEAVVGLMRDERGHLVTTQPRIDRSILDRLPMGEQHSGAG